MSLKRLTEEYNDNKYTMEIDVDITRLGVEADIEYDETTTITYAISESTPNLVISTDISIVYLLSLYSSVNLLRLI